VTLYDVSAGRVVERSERGRVEAGPLASALRRRGTASELVSDGKVVFRTPGRLGEVTSSPDGRWLLAGWPAADQWLFVKTDGTGLRAVSNVSEQFRSRAFPRVEGWCCS
jgi:hypothetical protein